MHNLDSTTRHAERAVDAVLAAIGAGLRGDGRVQLPGFGSFQISERVARRGRHPASGEPMDIAASRSVSFRAALKLRGSVGDLSRAPATDL